MSPIQTDAIPRMPQGVSDALEVVTNPEKYAEQVTLRRLAWAVLTAARRRRSA